MIFLMHKIKIYKSFILKYLKFSLIFFVGYFICLGLHLYLIISVRSENFCNNLGRIIEDYLMASVLYDFAFHILMSICQSLSSFSIHPVNWTVIKFDRKLEIIFFNDCLNSFFRIYRPFEKLIKSCLACSIFLWNCFKIFCPSLLLIVFEF